MMNKLEEQIYVDYLQMLVNAYYLFINNKNYFAAHKKTAWNTYYLLHIWFYLPGLSVK